jgi:cysteine desulfurase/selenocysteine lyase
MAGVAATELRIAGDVRADFPLLAADPGLHYLDSAATSQKPRAVLDALREYYETSNANPHRGAYRLSVAATNAYHAARERIASFFGVSDSDCIIFTRGTTEAINLVATSTARTRPGIGPGDEILVTAMEHHANFVPWQQLAIAGGATLRICEITADGRLDLEQFESLLSARTRVVAIAHVSNAIGTIHPIAAMARRVREKSRAIIVCDGAQSAPHLGVSFDDLGVDFYAFSGHKMLGPMGIGALIGRRGLLEQMEPYQMGGDMIEFVMDDHTTWNALPHKFEAGTPNVGDAVGLAAACEYLTRLGMERVRAHELALLRSAEAALRGLDGVTVYGPPPEERSGVLSFNVAGVHPHDVSTILDSRGVCIRAGHHCAQPLMRRLGVAATARASFYVYSTQADIGALLDGVQAARTLFGSDGQS